MDVGDRELVIICDGHGLWLACEGKDDEDGKDDKSRDDSPGAAAAWGIGGLFVSGLRNITHALGSFFLRRGSRTLWYLKAIR